MIRFILKRSRHDGSPFPGSEWEGYETIDLDVPKLEQALKRGGRGAGHDITLLVGAELDPQCGPQDGS